ncbi:amino acid adenylation domain-containing protein [Candidatus Nephthysia bennettiae]|uniref:Amino acid adenylation domain-containing protein n=1 Tax=Candidatus Nephthysia bennettiae TaxID=3127016 RepID=A0A934N144_9BACT|nr:amino acid adenylation domain-containing protein [Candidatus Dormibacteraeota bacterium]MBJ7612687.1 amino acid adenylation domain-containing protein [Candidatus Dormibacteraeota bacterium]
MQGLVAACAAAGPDAPAVADWKGVLSYGELDARAGRLASRLQDLGVRRGDRVGLCLPRSRGFTVGALGILKTGAAYVPLDPGYPADRLSYMLADSAATVVVTAVDLAPRLLPGPWTLLDIEAASHPAATVPTSAAAGPVETGPDDVAYVIYTSGSTGRPKGVEVTHGSLLNLVFWHRRAFAVSDSDQAMQVASPSFDAVVWETWPYLTAGATVHVPDETTRATPEALRDWMAERGITIGFVPTPVTEALLGLEWPPGTSLRTLLTGGDVLHRRPPAGLPFTLVNNYGPTEGTVVTTSGTVEPGEHGSLPSIGRPITNVRVHVLDSSLAPVALGEPGELCVAGEGLARGYLNQPGLTEEKFVPDPFGEPGDRLYRTGDLVRWSPQGEIEFLGRLDEQVKIRGFRIELHEITAVLDRHPGVRGSAVITREEEGGEKRLVAYVVASPGERPAVDGLRDHLARHLPDYMLPAAFVWLDELPLTANGKVDRAALPEPVREADGANPALQPRTPLEAALAGMLCDLLGLEEVGVDENFFVLGGHSLLGAQLIVRIRDRFGVELSLRNLFDNPTVEAIAQTVERMLVEQLETMSEEEAEKRLALLAPSE